MKNLQHRDLFQKVAVYRTTVCQAIFVIAKNRLSLATTLTLAAVCGNLQAAPVTGEATEFPKENGLVEECIRIEDFPGAHYSERDRKTEAKYCKLDFSKLALCPKLWSTSPGTILYEIDATDYSGDYAQFERQHCAEGRNAKKAALRKVATFKVSVNASGTSATYAPASWVYYHLSRYFRTNVRVPVAVYRSMDASAHNQRVAKPALLIVADRENLRMLGAGWKTLDAIENGLESGRAAQAALTDDGRQVFGVLLENKGDRYRSEFNGTRESGWGVGQNLDFQKTAPFLALRSGQPVTQAVKAAILEARMNPLMARDLPADTSVEQVVLWMQELLEITLLDFILGQQDRIGNIDSNWRWYWVEDGKLESKAAHGKDVPEDISGFKPLRLRQSAINDNDAGVRIGYANFAAKTNMLEGLRHYNMELYQRLGWLVTDLESKGSSYRWMTESAGLSAKETDAITERVKQAFDLLHADCQSGALQFDLDPAQFLGVASSSENDLAVSCSVTNH